MISIDSPLRRLPLGLDQRQFLILDGIRHAAEIAGLADTRLRESLWAIAQTHEAGQNPEFSGQVTSAYLDAWAIVDAIDRLRSLAKLMPRNSEGTTPGDLLEDLKPIRDLRNVSDHLAQRLDYVVAKNAPALGRLSWLAMNNDSQGSYCVLLPGTLLKTHKFRIPEFGGLKVRLPVGHISLGAGEHESSLCVALEKASAVVDSVERGVRHAMEKLGLSSSPFQADVMVSMEVDFGAHLLTQGTG
ncbi:hypothetical protein [Variovorax rhizosphaerae]|uniref:Uncharacterized protein n=1 Tax=Variovorax rhizosphaerae TaxID=1836200 RepID=A0ABU8WCJ1_9BURK